MSVDTEIATIVADQLAPVRDLIARIEGRVAPEALTYGAAAQYLMCSDTHVRSMVRNGDLPTVKLGAQLVRIPRFAIDEWLRSQVSSPAVVALGGVAAGEDTQTRQAS